MLDAVTRGRATRNAVAIALATSSLTVLAVAACGGSGADRQAVGANFECGGVRFSRVALRAPTGAERGRSPEAGALRRLLRSVDARNIAMPKRGWRKLAGASGEALFTAGRDGMPITDYAVITRDGDEWRVKRFGGCMPRRVDEGFTIPSWRVAPGTRLRHRARIIPVEYVVGTCDPSRAGVERARRMGVPARIEVNETRHTVTATVLVHSEPPPKDQACPALGVRVRAKIQLKHPLGQGVVVRDGSTLPPARVARVRG